jgi:hypothetical protein
VVPLPSLLRMVVLVGGAVVVPSRNPIRRAPLTAGRTCVCHRRKFSLVSFSVVPWLGRGLVLAAAEDEELIGCFCGRVALIPCDVLV